MVCVGLLALFGIPAAIASEAPQQGTVQFIPSTKPLAVEIPFKLEATTFTYSISRFNDRPFGLDEFEVTFPSPMTTASIANNTVHCEYFAPRGSGKRPGVIVLHILGGDFPLSRLCCRALASNGVGALFVKMPYYGPRRDPATSARMISADLQQTINGMTQAVLDIRCAAAWLSARQEIDANQLGITGISLGGIVAALAAESEPRFDRVFLVLAGGQFGRVAWESEELADAKKQWQADGLTMESITEIIQPVDPITYAANLRDRKMVMINATRDEVIPRECAESLWIASGKPRIIWWDATHYSAAWRLPGGLSEMARFFGDTQQ